MVTTIARGAEAAASFIDPAQPMAQLAREYLESLLTGDRGHAARIVLEAVEDGTDIRDVYLRVLEPAQREIGRLWQVGEIGVAKEHFCTAVTQLVISRLSPMVFQTERNGRRMTAVCAGPELHEVGLRIVSDFFELAGWDTDYLGGFLPPADVVSMVRERPPDLLAISVTMRDHVESASELIRAVRSMDAANRPAILVGGYTFNAERALWREIGADGYGTDAGEAVALAGRLAGGEELH